MADYEKSSKDLSAKELISILVVMAILLVGAVPVYNLILKQADKMNCKNNQQAAVEILNNKIEDYLIDDTTCEYEGTIDTKNGGSIVVDSDGLSEVVMNELVSALDESGCVPLENEKWTLAADYNENGDYSIEIICENPKHTPKK